ncbi:hypothetical protein C2E23DRAFT_818719 [Lenzites betulinus]|nr:hypothetical protein C2E23DRAFT_818719 [Lenzites betulinus]
MKTKSARESASIRAPRPYDSVKRPQKCVNNAENPIVATQSQTKSNPPPPSTFGNEPVLFRNLCMMKIRQKYPGVEPRNDFEIARLCERRFHGSPAEIYAELDKQLAQDAKTYGYDVFMGLSTKLLDTYMEPTGIKPDEPCPDPKFVFVRPVPGSKYSIRLFPGSVSAAEYCMDFVESATGKPVNSPFQFELWGIPNLETPWLSIPMCGQLRSIEKAHGIKQKDILPGEEKFILRDGQTCVLKRPGKRPFRFTVPIRRLPKPKVPKVETQDVADLPKFIDM